MEAQGAYAIHTGQHSTVLRVSGRRLTSDGNLTGAVLIDITPIRAELAQDLRRYKRKPEKREAIEAVLQMLKPFEEHAEMRPIVDRYNVEVGGLVKGLRRALLDFIVRPDGSTIEVLDGPEILTAKSFATLCLLRERDTRYELLLPHC